jgi:soluble epoxide hydrolase/lipid-phosphate phosphatase
MQLTSQRVSLSTGVTLNVYQAGTGPDVLLLHGITGCGTYWSVQIAQLVAAGYRVTAPDGRGHGESDRASDYSTESIAADAAALIQQLGLNKPIVIGHSMGGAQSLMLACQHPELVGKVVLEDPARRFGQSMATRPMSKSVVIRGRWACASG